MLRTSCLLALFMALSLPAGAAPDLTGMLTLDIFPQDAGKAKVTFDVVIENSGDQACNFFDVDLWTTYPCDCEVHPFQCGDASNQAWTGIALDAQDTMELSWEAVLSYSVLPYHFMLLVDTIDTCSGESNEDNNTYCGEFYVNDSVNGPNLVIHDCTIGPSEERPDWILVKAKITNEGNSPTDEVLEVDFHLDTDAGLVCDDHLDDYGQGWDQAPQGILPGQTVEVMDQIQDMGAGTFYPKYLINSLMSIEESSYLDNCCIPQDEFEFDPPLNWDRPDLVIRSFSVELQGNRAIFTGSIANEGYNPVMEGQQFKLCIYNDWPGQPGIDETPDPEAGTGFVIPFYDGILSGQELEFGQAGNKVVNGLHTYWARVDCDQNEVLEIDEKNNDAKQDLMVDIPGPDLAVSLFSASQQISDGELSFQYLIQVENKGVDRVEPPIDVDLFFDSQELPEWDSGSMPEGSYLVLEEGLDPGEKHQIILDWPEPPCPGTFQSWVVLDVANLIYEQDEENNWDGPLEVSCEEIGPFEGPNLALDNFRTSVVGRNIKYFVTIINSGDQDVDQPFRVDIHRDRETSPVFFEHGDPSWEPTALKVGEKLDLSWTWEGVEDGEYRSYVLVDTDNAITEANEADNLSGVRISTVCSACDQCREEVLLASACVCGEETVATGFCCSGVWKAAGCAYEGEDTVSSGDTSGDAYTADFTSFGKPDPGCGCRFSNVGQESSTGQVLMLLLAGLTALRLRRTRRS